MHGSVHGMVHGMVNGCMAWCIGGGGGVGDVGGGWENVVLYFHSCL